MTEYERIDKGTIDTKVGERFTIKGAAATHIDTILSFPEGAFRKVSERKGKLSHNKMGARPKTIYCLEALKSGTYEIEYQRLNPPLAEKNPGQVCEADVYKVNVAPED